MVFINDKRFENIRKKIVEQSFLLLIIENQTTGQRSRKNKLTSLQRIKKEMGVQDFLHVHFLFTFSDDAIYHFTDYKEMIVNISIGEAKDQASAFLQFLCAPGVITFSEVRIMLRPV